MRWWLTIGQTRQGRRQGQDRNARPDPLTRNCNACEHTVTEAKTQEIKEEPATGLCSIGNIGGYAKPDQYARGVYRIGHGSARASDC